MSSAEFLRALVILQTGHCGKLSPPGSAWPCPPQARRRGGRGAWYSARENLRGGFPCLASRSKMLNSAEVEFMRAAAGGGVRGLNGKKAFSSRLCIAIKVFVSVSLPAHVSHRSSWVADKSCDRNAFEHRECLLLGKQMAGRIIKRTVVSTGKEGCASCLMWSKACKGLSRDT